MTRWRAFFRVVARSISRSSETKPPTGNAFAQLVATLYSSLGLQDLDGNALCWPTLRVALEVDLQIAGDSIRKSRTLKLRG